MEVEEVQRRSRHGPILMMGRRFGGITLNLITLTIVAHLISPREFGLATMSLVVFSLAEIFKDFGLTAAVMRKGNASQREMSFLFWFNIATTVFVSAILALSAGAVSTYFHEPVVRWIIYATLVGFLIGGCASQHGAMLARELRFDAMAIVDLGALLAQAVITLSLAFVMHNVWAIVIGNVSYGVISGILNVALSRWKPLRPQMAEDVKDLLAFGANASIFSFSIFLTYNIAPILIGHFIGPAPLGQFNRAQTLFMFPMRTILEPITQAAMPVMMRLRPHPELYKKVYLELSERLSVMIMPASVVLTFAATPLVELILGAKWHEAGGILSALAPSLAGSGLSYAVNDLFITENRAKALRNIGLAEMVARSGSIAIGVHFGTIWAAVGFTVSVLFFSVPLRLYMASKGGSISLQEGVGACFPGIPPAFGALIGCSAVWLLGHHVSLTVLSTAILSCSFGVLGAAILGLGVPSSRRGIGSLAEAFHIPGARMLTGKAKAG